MTRAVLIATKQPTEVTDEFRLNVREFIAAGTHRPLNPLYLVQRGHTGASWANQNTDMRSYKLEFPEVNISLAGPDAEHFIDRVIAECTKEPDINQYLNAQKAMQDEIDAFSETFAREIDRCERQLRSTPYALTE